MQSYSDTAARHRALLVALIVGVATALCLAPRAASAQAATGVSADPHVRATQQWEDVLLLEDFDYLQLTAQQCKQLQTLAGYARTRMDEVEQQRARVRKTVEEQYQALLKGQRPTDSEQQDVLQKQRQILEREELVSREIVDSLAPKLGGVLTRKQTVRAWLLMQNRVAAAEPKRSALTDPASGFVLPQMEGRDAIEEMVKVGLRKTYPQDVIDQSLTPWEFASFASLGGLGGPRGPGGPGGGQDPTKALQAIQEMDPRMGARMLMLGQRMIKQFQGGGDQSGTPTPPVPPETRAAINRDAVALRKSIESDPEAFMSQARSEQMLEALRPLARRLFLSARIAVALQERESQR
jgi:hypothetical protein